MVQGIGGVGNIVVDYSYFFEGELTEMDKDKAKYRIINEVSRIIVYDELIKKRQSEQIRYYGGK
jgi:D-arabinose 1-dehydrogenase-like Zn-dependent alcohol dehydrogenase